MNQHVAERLVGPTVTDHPAWPDYRGVLEHLSGHPVILDAKIEPSDTLEDFESGLVVYSADRNRPVLKVLAPDPPQEWRLDSIVQLLHAMIQWMNDRRGPWPKPSRVVWRLIQNHSDQPLDLGSIAKHLDMAPARLGEQFTQVTGSSFRRWLGEERCSCAAQLLLENPNRPIAEIASVCSRQSVSQFNRNFLSATGATPRQFRRSVRS